MTEGTLREAAATIANATEIALACHVNPDGDALGSMLGLFHVLRAADLPVVASFPTPSQQPGWRPRATPPGW